MKLLRYLMTIFIASAVNPQAFANATEDTVNAIYKLGQDLGIILSNPKGADALYFGGPDTGGIKTVPFSADMKKYFDDQLKNAVRDFNKNLEDLKNSISRLPAGDLKTIAEGILQTMKGTQTEMQEHPDDGKVS